MILNLWSYNNQTKIKDNSFEIQYIHKVFVKCQYLRCTFFHFLIIHKYAIKCYKIKDSLL